MLHESTFQYLKPTDSQIEHMAIVRDNFAKLISTLETDLFDGPDKTYVIRKVREAAMWANVCITREADGTPRV